MHNFSVCKLEKQGQRNRLFSPSEVSRIASVSLYCIVAFVCVPLMMHQGCLHDWLLLFNLLSLLHSMIPMLHSKLNIGHIKCVKKNSAPILLQNSLKPSLGNRNLHRKFPLDISKNLGKVFGMKDKLQENRELLYRWDKVLFFESLFYDNSRSLCMHCSSPAMQRR